LNKGNFSPGNNENKQLSCHLEGLTFLALNEFQIATKEKVINYYKLAHRILSRDNIEPGRYD